MLNLEQAQTELLNDILQPASNLVLTQRFSAENQAAAAACTGKCVSGECRGFI